MATKDKLKFGENQFLTATRGSHDKAVKLLTFHVAVLQQMVIDFPLDTDYPVWLARTITLRNTAVTEYNNYYSVEAAQTGETKTVALGLKNIKGKAGKARDWYNRTAAIYAITDPARMQAIYPRGLKPFRGKIDNIIGALSTLASNIGLDATPLMVAIKNEVLIEYGIIIPDRTSQKSAFTATDRKSTRLNSSHA